MVVVGKLDCGILLVINLLQSLAKRDGAVRSSLVLGVPPSPHPLKGLLGAGFAKSVAKILMAKSLEVKI